MNVKINGSFGLEEVYNTYKQIERWVKTPSITLKTDDIFLFHKKTDGIPICFYMLSFAISITMLSSKIT